MKCLHVCCEKVINDCMSSEFIYCCQLNILKYLLFWRLVYKKLKMGGKCFLQMCIRTCIIEFFSQNQIIYLICSELTELLMTV